jgi:WD40 repeat protein
MGSDYPAKNELQPSAVMPAHSGVVGAVAMSPDGRHAASGGVDGWIRIWDLAQSPPREVASLPRPGTEIQAIVFAPDDPQYLVYGGTQQGNARVQRWDWSENRVYDWGGFNTTDHRGVGALTFSNDGTLFAAGIGSFAVTWKVHKRTASSRNILKGQGTAIRGLAFSPDHRLLVTAGDGRSIRFWGFGWLGTSLKATAKAHADSITSLAFSPDGKRLATVGLDRHVVLWDPLTPSEDTAIVLSGHTNNLRLVQFLSGGKHIVSVGENGQVFYWDVLAGQVVNEFNLDLSLVYCVALSPDSRRLIAGHSNGQIALFQMSPNFSRPTASSQTVMGRR